jgi:hypothetical protein
MLVGSWASGQIVQYFTFSDGAGVVRHHWDRIWTFPALAAAAILVFFALFFREPVKPKQPTALAA